jgi:glycosyltransferase involved in cell wall biosynthesis
MLAPEGSLTPGLRPSGEPAFSFVHDTPQPAPRPPAAPGNRLILDRWAVVGPHDDTGLGRQAQDIKQLFRMQQLVVSSDRLSQLPLVPGRDHPLDASLGEAGLKKQLGRLDGILVMERANWHPDLCRLAKSAGVKVVAYVNWEWFRGTDPEWKLCDLFVCPSPFTVDIVKSYGLGPACYVPWALNLSRFRERVVTGQARVFFHNAGLVDHDDRKGTRDTIRAFMRSRRADLRLIVRLQKSAPLPPIDSRIEVRVGNLPDPADLYAEGDVAIQPSKMEGCGLQILEPVCVGLPVITTDYPPMNDHVRQREMLVRKRWLRRSAFPARAAAIRHAHLRLPSLGDLTRRLEWCADHDLSAISRSNRSYGLQVYGPEALAASWRKAFSGSGFVQG